MPKKFVNQSKPPTGARPAAPPETFHSSPDELADGIPLNSDSGRMLIVDDDPGTRERVSKMAAHLGYNPTSAADAMDALFYLTKARYDVVITDYDIPCMDGYQLADQIKETHFGTQVIIMTDHCEREVTDILAGSDIVDGLLLKPFTLKAMQAKIEIAGHPRSGKRAL